MFFAVKESKVIAIHELEWRCRMIAKGIDKPSYWTWLATVTSGDPPVYDFSGEDYEIVEIYSRSYESTDDEGNSITIQADPLSYESTDEDGNTRTISFNESGHITSDSEGTYYHLKWDATKKEIVKDDTAKDAHDLAEEWKRIRAERNRLLAETDWVVIKARENGGTVPAAWKTYRVALRDIPAEQSDKTKYSEITWPTKPS